VYDGCQSWETAFIIQAYCETGLVAELGPSLHRAYDFINKSQVQHPSIFSIIVLHNIFCNVDFNFLS